MARLYIFSRLRNASVMVANTRVQEWAHQKKDADTGENHICGRENLGNDGRITDSRKIVN
jgi:hypothetical protein